MNDTFYPLLQPTVIAVPVQNGRIAIHQGTRQGEASEIIEDPTGWKVKTLNLLNGEYESKDIINIIDKQKHQVDEGELKSFLDYLKSKNYIQDRKFFDYKSLTNDQKERYSRNLNGFAALGAAQMTPEEYQQKLFMGHVLLLGCGGLGSCTATALAMAGCGQITLVDFDDIELSNLNRQLYTVSDVGVQKVDGLKARLKDVNPEITVNTVVQRITGVPDIVELILKFKPDIVVAAIDRPVIAADRWISDACFNTGIPGVFNSVSAGMGMFWTKYPGKSGCFRCDEKWSEKNNPDHHAMRLWREKHDLIPATSAFSHSAMIIGGMMSADIIRNLVGWPMISSGKLVSISFTTLETNVTEKPQHPSCECCAP
ncbi:ThiF family adenylyltransferase (plasmid) [Pantoea agglomerans]|uniref:ThiF family adenylyltransferase n=1 Tax=Enterobacter agglomerans TaxID=549 RepID=UPI00177F9186|nr:ThiF family adenylyltransferase [Pantoea agglomerans]WLO87366.1 ThiF family adenylyltransferase [Pantoea agglomerans]WVJ49091.1 ThiF family adenylyltransferase [Pantoea agglomerans]